MKDKGELKKAAGQLAETRLMARVFYHRFLAHDNSITSDTLAELQKKAEGQKKEILILQSGIEECRDKVYWWSLPFDIKNPPTGGEGMVSLPGAVYSVQDNFNPDVVTMDSRERKEPVPLFLERVGITGMALYTDRKFLKEHLHGYVTEKVILAAQPLDRLKTMIGNVNLKGQDYSYADMCRDLDNLACIDRNFPAKLRRLNEQWDLRERIRHGSLWNNEDAWAMGQLSTDDYVAESVWRDTAVNQMKQKYEAERSFLMWRLEMAKVHRKENEGQLTRRAMLADLAETMSGERIRVMRCAYAYYLGNKLVGIVLPSGSEEVYEVVYAGDVSLYDIHALTIQCRKIAEGKPDYDALIGFLMSGLGAEMKPYPLLSSRPRGVSDGLWQLWTENRFLYDFLERGQE